MVGNSDLLQVVKFGVRKPVNEYRGIFHHGVSIDVHPMAGLQVQCRMQTDVFHRRLQEESHLQSSVMESVDGLLLACFRITDLDP